MRVRGLVVGRAGFRAGPLELDISRGSLTTLIGPNGGGKTTLLKTLAGVLPPVTGKVETEGLVALLPPPGSATVPFTVRHFVLLGRAGQQAWNFRFPAADEARVDEVLAGLDLEPLRDRRFDRLSSGQQQRVLLARALAQDASVCLLDEPFALLDPAQSAQIEAALTTLRTVGRAIVIATHDIALARRSDQVIAIGPSIAVGTPNEMTMPDRQRALYGGEIELCQRCGHVSGVTTSGD